MKPTMSKAVAGIRAKYAAIKLDGHYVRVIVTDSDIAFESSLGTTLRLPEHVFDVADRLPAGIYLGELWTPGKPASSVKTAIKEGWRDLQITYFASETMEIGTPLEDLHQFFDKHEQNFVPYEIINSVPVELSDAELFMYKQRARISALEGWVFSTGNLTGWAKLKVENTIDLVVIGATVGNGKYGDYIGSLVCGLRTPHNSHSVLIHGLGNIVEVANVSGMDDKTRRELTASCNSGCLVGTVIECKYQNVDSKGRLRHPRFLRVREDKLPYECLVSQDKELEKYYNGNGLNSSADSSL